MPAAIPAVIAGVTTIGGALITNSAQKSAANQANQAQQQSTAQQIQLLRDLYAQNSANETPFLNSGYGAQSAIMQLLGIAPSTATQFNNGQWLQPGSYAPVTPLETPRPASPTGPEAQGNVGTTAPSTTATAAAPTGYTGPSFSQIAAMKGNGIKGDMGAAMAQYLAYYQAHPNEDPGISGLGQVALLKGDHIDGDEAAVTALYNNFQNYRATNPQQSTVSQMLGGSNYIAPQAQEKDYGAVVQDAIPAPVQTAVAQPVQTAVATPTATPAAPTGVTIAGGAATPTAQQSITDIIRATPGYDFRYNQGLKAMMANPYAGGYANSGATAKAAQEYGQNFASNEYQNYLNNLFRVASGGASAAGALANVSQQYGSDTTSAMQNAADSASRTATARANATGSLVQGITSGIGSIAGSGIFGAPKVV